MRELLENPVDCPFDLDKPATVWKNCLPLPGISEACFPTCEEAIAARGYQWGCLGKHGDMPIEWILSSLLELCKAIGVGRLMLCNRTGQVIEEYPL